MTLWNLKPSVQGVGWENIQWCNFSNEVAEMWLEFWEIGDVLNSWDSRDGDALGQLWTKNLFKSADSGRLSFSIWTTWKIIIFCKLLFQPALCLYTIWDFKFFSFVLAVLIIAYWSIFIMDALKFLSEFQHLCHLGVELHWLSFLIQPEISLILGIMKYFHLCLGHFGYYVMRLWVLFKSYLNLLFEQDSSDSTIGREGPRTLILSNSPLSLCWHLRMWWHSVIAGGRWAWASPRSCWHHTGWKGECV